MSSGAASSLKHQFTPSVWAAVSVRVAWTLMMEGIRVSPATLVDARDHVLLSLPKGVDAEEAEQRSGLLTVEFLERVRGKPVRRNPINSTAEVHVHLGWRARLSPVLDPVADAVLRLHYGDGMSLEQVERTAAIDGVTLGASQDGLREVVRDIAVAEGHPAHSWADTRVDQLISRVANLPEPGCPPAMDILSDHSRSHADLCPRCARAVRMIRGGVIAPSDLSPPADGADAQQVVVGAVILHPDARRLRRKLERALGSAAVRAGTDVWIMSKAELTRAGTALRALVSDGLLPRHHLRGAVVRGPGRWAGQVLLGPTAIEAIESARSRPWSEVDTLGELPPPRPAPPKATRWWLATAAIGLLTVMVGVETFGPQVQAPDRPIEAQFLSVEDGWEITFDVDDLAVIDIVALSADGPTVMHSGVRASRGQWATGGGNYRVYVPEETVVLLASEAGIDGLTSLVTKSRAEPSPMVALETWIRTDHPTVAWVGSPAITPVDPGTVQAAPDQP